MTMGYICDGPCGMFWTGRKVGAEVKFLLLLNDDGDTLPPTDSQICPECSVDLFAKFGPSGYRNTQDQPDNDDTQENDFA